MAGEQRLLLDNARQLVLVCARGETHLARGGARGLAVLEAASAVVGRDGCIKAVGPVDAIRRQFSETSFEKIIDCSGKCVLPGDRLISCVRETESLHKLSPTSLKITRKKLAGASYMDIHQAGGGIHFTVEHTQKASEEELFNTFKHRLLRMISAGTTLVECKSGYGLNLETELKMLRVIERAKRLLDISISSTYCGAHSVPNSRMNLQLYPLHKLSGQKKKREGGE